MIKSNVFTFSYKGWHLKGNLPEDNFRRSVLKIALGFYSETFPTEKSQPKLPEFSFYTEETETEKYGGGGRGKVFLYC